MENLYKAKTLRKSKRINEFKTPLTQVISRILERGEKEGIFRNDIEPIDLYISICALGFMYFANQHTLKVIFNRDLMSPESLKRRRETIIDLILSYLNPANPSDQPVRTNRMTLDTLIL
jgi:TetR/AcrR family transcriptional regulator